LLIGKMPSKVAVKRTLDRLLGASGYQVLAIMLRTHPIWGRKTYFFPTLLNSIRFYLAYLAKGADFFIEIILKRPILEAGLPSFDEPKW